MSDVTIAVPVRWEPAMLQIKQFIEDYARIANVQFDVILTFQLDPEQIYIAKDSLGPSERVVCQNAVSEMSDYLNHLLSKDPWQARDEITNELQRTLEEIRDVVRQRETVCATEISLAVTLSFART